MIRFGLTLLLLAAAAAAAEDRPPLLREVGFEQRIGATVPRDLELRDEEGRPTRLGAYFGTRPVVLVPAYYTCPMLCPLVLNGVVRALRALPFDVGADLTVLTFSFDPADTSERAAAKRNETLAEYRRSGAAAGWHFLVGDEAAIHRLTEAIGFRAARDAARGQYAHASGLVVLTPEGTISRYLYGVEYAPRDLRLALVEASAGRLGSPVDQLLLFCFHYDAATGRYGGLVLGAVRAGGLLTLLALGAGVALLVRREGAGRRARA